MYSIDNIHKILSCPGRCPLPNTKITSLEFDTRKISKGEQALFFCLTGKSRDGHDYIEKAYQKGVRSFVVAKLLPHYYDDCNYLIVKDVLRSLQKIAADHLNRYPPEKIIGITGSNGKTIVKEWLFQLLDPYYKITRSPWSYNSQIGVALSLWEIQPDTEVAIIEAGISQPGEMSNIAELLHPEIGIITNIGDAHQAHFENIQQKIKEKCILFKDSATIIYCDDHQRIKSYLRDTYPEKNHITWGQSTNNFLSWKSVGKDTIAINYKHQTYQINIDNTGYYYIENLMHAITAALICGLEIEEILSRLPLLDHFSMRLEHIQGIDDSTIINDAYVADLSSLKLGMDHLIQHSEGKYKALILSDFADSGNGGEIIEEISAMLKTHQIDRLITVGQKTLHLDFEGERYHYTNTHALYQTILDISWQNYVILLKGSRIYKLDTLVEKLERSSHSAYLEIDLLSLHHNLATYRSKLNPETGFIAVIKASAYGGGWDKIVRAIEKHDPSYLAVAYTDEGISLRSMDISRPIIVLNPDEEKLGSLFQYQLEPEVYSLPLLQKITQEAQVHKSPIAIHLKVDTGMHRLGLSGQEIQRAVHILYQNPKIRIKTVMSHLSSAENEAHDQYSKAQAQKFVEIYDQLVSGLGENPKRHLLNSEGTLRFPEYQYDYVRIGLGMYGISENHSNILQKVHSLYAKIIHIKTYAAGSAIGYGRSEILQEDTIIGVINIGYADGLMRMASNGMASVYYKGKRCPIVGRVCMDLTMINLNKVPDAKIGDNVEIFGKNIPIEKLANQLQTIPYEILTRISSRIVRKYVID